MRRRKKPARRRICCQQEVEDEKADDMIKALKKAAGFIRRELGFRVDLRYTPELIFVSDRNIAYGVHIAKVLSEAIGTEGRSGDDDEQKS